MIGVLLEFSAHVFNVEVPGTVVVTCSLRSPSLLPHLSQLNTTFVEKTAEKLKISYSKPFLHQEKDDFVDEDKKMNWALPRPESY